MNINDKHVLLSYANVFLHERSFISTYMQAGARIFSIVLNFIHSYLITHTHTHTHTHTRTYIHTYTHTHTHTHAHTYTHTYIHTHTHTHTHTYLGYQHGQCVWCSPLDQQRIHRWCFQRSRWTICQHLRSSGKLIKLYQYA